MDPQNEYLSLAQEMKLHIASTMHLTLLAWLLTWDKPQALIKLTFAGIASNCHCCQCLTILLGATPANMHWQLQ